MAHQVSELLDALPLCASTPPLENESVPDGVRYVTHTRPEFVAPPLTLDSSDLADAQVVVITASAAVGKSMLAEYIALRTGAVLWDLSRAMVGNNFAVGTLAMSHGTARLSSTVGMLQSGTFLVVADALDEARLRVTFDAFTAFLDDLARQIARPLPLGKPSIVLTARSETAEFTAEWLGELDVNVALVEIDFFEEGDARDFVDKQLASRKVALTPVIHEAEDLIFSRTLQLLGCSPDDPWPLDPARRFLGYAPVLAATARYLSSSANPKRLVEDLAARHQDGPIWDFLFALARDILLREQTKFLEGFREVVRLKAELIGFHDWDALFTPDEQCALLVTNALGIEPPHSSAPSEIHDEYRAEAQSWLPEHAFTGPNPRLFSSPVFEDFTYASVLVHGDERVRAAMRARTANARYRPTEMLARFAIALADAPLLAEDMPVLYESLLAADGAGRDMALSIVETDDGELSATVLFGRELLSFALVAAGEPLRFITRLGRAAIAVRTSAIYLGVSGRLFEVGPDTFIIAPSVEVSAETLFVVAPKGAPADSLEVVIIAGALTASDPTLRFVHGKEHFAAQTPRGALYPFADRTLKSTRFPARLTEEDRQAATAFFRLAGHFKTEGYGGGLGSHADPIERMANRSPLIRAVLDVGQEKAIVVRDGAFYRLYPSMLGLDYRAVRAQELTPEAAEFAQAVAAVAAQSG